MERKKTAKIVAWITERLAKAGRKGGDDLFFEKVWAVEGMKNCRRG